MSRVGEFLARLDGVRETARGSWVARCPAHEDRKPSLAIRELNDGTVLVHCFAGCDVGAASGWTAFRRGPRIRADALHANGSRILAMSRVKCDTCGGAASNVAARKLEREEAA